MIYFIKFVVTIKQHKLKFVYKSSKVLYNLFPLVQETYLLILSPQNIKRYRNKGYKGFYPDAIKVKLQLLFLRGKNVICFLAILNIKWQTFEKALLLVVEVGLNQGHVIIQVEPNFHLRFA